SSGALGRRPEWAKVRKAYATVLYPQRARWRPDSGLRARHDVSRGDPALLAVVGAHVDPVVATALEHADVGAVHESARRFVAVAWRVAEHHAVAVGVCDGQPCASRARRP